MAGRVLAAADFDPISGLCVTDQVPCHVDTTNLKQRLTRGIRVALSTPKIIAVIPRLSPEFSPYLLVNLQLFLLHDNVFTTLANYYVS